jgi:serine/threonine protein kinase
LKPENIGFDIRGDVKVFDFGLAKSLFPHLRDAKDGMYHLTGRTGSYPYMAPEVAKGDQTYDEKCDVYSFGILFWQILCLKKPFPRLRTHKECFNKVTIGGLRPPVPRGLVKKWSPAIEDIVTLSWKEFPKDRPSMKDISAMLRAELKALRANDDESLDIRSRLLAEKSRRSLHQSLMRNSSNNQLNSDRHVEHSVF